MIGAMTSPRDPAVVVCVHGASGGSPVPSRLVRAGVQTLGVDSPYEAAAEILAGQASVLVVDVAFLRGPHVRLLDIARNARVPVVGLHGDQWPGLGDGLDELTTVTEDAVVTAVQQALRRAGTIEPAPAASSPSGDAPGPQAAAAPAGAEAPPRTSVSAEEVSPPAAVQLTPAKTPPAPVPGDPSASAGKPAADLLTSQELAALLGDEP